VKPRFGPIRRLTIQAMVRWPNRGQVVKPISHVSASPRDCDAGVEDRLRAPADDEVLAESPWGEA
jgi:hypothetical protein